jgi:spermidine synthase
MPRRSYAIACLLFASGTCALIYQVAWLRELRLVFGASTPASAAVLAVFMAGLGYGSLVLGRRAETAARPLLLYAKLEAGIALTAALTPLLLWGVRAGYVALGGSTSLGLGLGTAVRLLLAALVLLPPTLLMGGTLPAATRAAMKSDDVGRRTAALLYGCNTLGAVTGASVSTFLMLEAFGTRQTLWLGCGLNLAVAVMAWAGDGMLAEAEARDRAAAASGAAPPSEQPAAAAAPAADPRPAAPAFVLAAAAVVGFVFMAMELVWYRMLSPLLGGSTYTFGLILAMALLGIGLGGLLYTLRGASARARLGGLGLTCLLEAALLALPYALGDRVALFAITMRSLGAFGQLGYMAGWAAVCALVVVPASIVAGYQFPLLIALLGTGRQRVGRQVGLAYAFNTLGAILGSLCTGFVLMPRLTAPGAWRYAVWLLVLLGLVAVGLQLREQRRLRARWLAAPLPGLAALVALWMVLGPLGPTAVWRHSPIGAGRSDDLVQDRSPNGMRAAVYERRRAVSWEADGRESSVALYSLNDVSFLVNGKSDGAAVLDGGTQVMGGLLGALLHQGRVHQALVIGLGTGSTAGWLGRLPDIERVDVVELEPAILNVARACAPVNAGVLDNPKVHIFIGDAREVLLTTPRRYDLIFSEPSNPYRAGVASLFTREFYQAARQRLQPDGVFVQWLQAYEIDAPTIRTVYTTVSSVFPSVDSWRTKDSDLILLGREADLPLDVPQVRARVAEEPYRAALMAVWRVSTLEGVLAHYVAQPSFARAVAKLGGPRAVSTDDRNLLEYSFPRALGGTDEFRVLELRTAAVKRDEQWPVMSGLGAPGGGAIDWEQVQDELISFRWFEGENPSTPPEFTMNESQQQRQRAQLAWHKDDAKAVLSAWESQPREPRNAIELMVVADAYATEAREQAEPLMARLAAWEPVEASAIRARLRWAQGRREDCRQALVEAVVAYRTDPWASNELMNRTLPLALALAQGNKALGPQMVELLTPRLNVDSLTYQTRSLRLELGLLGADPAACVQAIADEGPWVPWERGFLQQRVDCYKRAKHPDLGRAESDLRDFAAGEHVDFGVSLPAAPKAATRAQATAAPSGSAEPSVTASASSAAASGSAAATAQGQ